MNIPGAEDLSLRPGALAPFGLPGLAPATGRVTGKPNRWGRIPIAARTGRNSPLTEECVIDVRIETFKAIHVARIRNVGPVMDMGPCFERLFRWAASVGAETGRVLTLSYDHPGTVAPGERRRDACVELHTHGLPAPGIAMGFVGAGRHAVYRHRGAHEGIAGAYRRLFTQWLPQSGEAVDDRP